MADMTFACPHCNQHISCDEAWGGHEIQCPSCQGSLTVPQPAQPAPPPQAAASSIATAAELNNPLVPKPPAQSRLALSQPAQRPAQEKGNIPIRNLAPPTPPKKNPAVKIAAGAVAVIVLGVGGYFGYQQWQQRAEAQKREAAKAAASTPTPAAAEPAASIPVVWTLDLDAAKIPGGPANGSIAGASFSPESVHVDPVGSAQVLRLTQGSPLSPDREILVYLHLKPGEQLGGQTLSISKDMRGEGVPQVMKRWKPMPQSALQSKSFPAGYAMRLELGQMQNGEVPGKIFIALPDTEQTVVAGTFKAMTGAPAAQARTPAATPPPTPRAGTVSAPERYGITPGIGP